MDTLVVTVMKYMFLPTILTPVMRDVLTFVLATVHAMIYQRYELRELKRGMVVWRMRQFRPWVNWH
jgi:hypothetical protein